MYPGYLLTFYINLNNDILVARYGKPKNSDLSHRIIGICMDDGKMYDNLNLKMLHK